MEPMDIDWKNIESNFIKDDLYEHINAPKYIDFSAPEEFVDDDAWFCRPDCGHPKNSEDFKVKHLRSVSCSEIVPLGERNRCRDANLKRRGVAPSENPRSRKPAKSVREDGENEKPNLSPLPSPNGLKIAKSRTFKSTIKSSAEKEREKENSPLDVNPSDTPKREERLRQLKSTNSARNLFSGREILNQITEFYSEFKKLALNTSDRESSATKSMGAEEKEKEPQLEAETAGLNEQRNLTAKNISSEGWNEKKMMDDSEKTQAVSAGSNLSAKRKGNRSILQVRSCPPSPQRFPSPLKPPKSRTAKRGILQDLEQTQIRTSKPIDEENKDISVSNEEAKPMDMFWFLKPCAYLGK